MTSLIGQIISRYQVIGTLGQGGMAEVYRAHDTVLDRDVALKLMLAYRNEDQAVKRRFYDEARAIARLKHPHIVTIYEFGEFMGRPFLVMELLEGHALSDLVQPGQPWPVDRVVRLLAQVASALDYAHGQAMVHRDVKPGNIIVGAGDHATLTDFGLVRVVEGTQLTQSGMLLGTPAYMSPEQVLGENVGPASDLYSLAVMAYELFTGLTPFRHDSSVATLHAHAYEPPPPLRSINPALSPAVEAVVSQALAKDPRRRYPSASAFVADLQAAIQGAKTAAKPAPPPSPPRPTADRSQATVIKPRGEAPPPPRRMTPVWLVGGALAGLVLLVAALAAQLGATRPPVPAASVAAPSSPTALAQAPQPTRPAASPTLPPVNTAPPALTPTSSASAAGPAVATPAATSAPAATATPPPTATAPPAPTATPPPPPTPLPTPAPPRLLMEDTFDGDSINEAMWVVDKDEKARAEVAHGVLRLDSIVTRYPYLYTRQNPFPSAGDFQVKVGFRYAEVRDCGVAILVSNGVVTPGLTEKEANQAQQEIEARGVQTGVWQDKEGLKLWYRSSEPPHDEKFPGPDTDKHEVMVRYQSGQYKLYLDNNLAYSSPINRGERPRYIWMGHPARYESACLWNVVEIDYVRVEALP